MNNKIKNIVAKLLILCLCMQPFVQTSFGEQFVENAVSQNSISADDVSVNDLPIISDSNDEKGDDISAPEDEDI